MTGIAKVLTIAGSDSGGGAGIQADLKSFSANGVYGASVITALTAQNTTGVTAVHDVPTDFVTAQLDAVFDDIRIDAVKIGMLSSTAVINAVAEGLEKYRVRNVVLDPVMVATTGAKLIQDDAATVLASRLIPLADLITPNLQEAQRLLDCGIAIGRGAMIEQGKRLLGFGADAVLMKGGHITDETAGRADDVLITAADERWFEAERVDSKNTHGTGCSLSSAIAAWLARGMELEEAVARAKKWLTGAIAASGDLKVGKGNGPVHHFHDLWPVD
jgi:hydroxymethylpyrimidine/phosphomethylpyrimidine kinase